MGLASFWCIDHTVCELKSFSVKDRFEQQLFELFPWYRCLPDTKPHTVRAKSIRHLLFHTSTHVFHTSTIPYYPHTSRTHVFCCCFSNTLIRLVFKTHETAMAISGGNTSHSITSRYILYFTTHNNPCLKVYW